MSAQSDAARRRWSRGVVIRQFHVLTRKNGAGLYHQHSALTRLIVILACTAGTTIILGLAILGLRRLLLLVREQKAAENPREPLDVRKLPKLPVR